MSGAIRGSSSSKSSRFFFISYHLLSFSDGAAPEIFRGLRQRPCVEMSVERGKCRVVGIRLLRQEQCRVAGKRGLPHSAVAGRRAPERRRDALLAIIPPL